MGELTRPRQLRLADKVTAEGLSQQGVRRTAAVLLVVLGLMGTTLCVIKPELPGGPANDCCIPNFTEEHLVS